MFKYTTYLLKKLEALFSDLNYEIRYAKGNFQAGYCIVEDRNVIVINTFFNTEARINVLLEILDTISVDPAMLSAETLKTFKKLQKEILSPSDTK